MKRLFLIFCVLCSLSVYAQERVDLTGLWECSVGDSLHYKDYVELPGAYRSQGEIWYRKSVYVPGIWSSLRVVLFLERPYVETTVFVNGEKILYQMSPSTPHQCDVTRWLKAGQRNTIVICVNSGTSRWNGITGCMELRVQPRNLYLDKVRLTPLLSKGRLHLGLDAGGAIADNMKRGYQYFGDYYVFSVMLDGDNPDNAMMGVWGLEHPHVECNYQFTDSVFLWYEYRPQLYRMGISLGDDYYETTFGMRELGKDSCQYTINDRPMLLRGTVESLCPMDSVCLMYEDEWEPIFSEYKKYGLNYVRFPYCPSEAAFQVADRQGLYLEIEDPTGSVEESKRIIDTYGHHPSFMMMSASQRADSVWEQTMLEYDSTKIYNPKFPLIAPGDSLHYKQAIEQILLTKGDAGFLLSSFKDVASKMGVDGWMEFCSPVVAVAKFPKTDYSNKDTLIVPVEICNAMYGNLLRVRNSYYLTDADQQVIGGGLLAGGDIPVGKNISIGTINWPLNTIKEPTKLTLTVVIAGKLKNHWDFWVHPEEDSQTADDEETPQTN